jgi:hypothetical protein
MNPHPETFSFVGQNPSAPDAFIYQVRRAPNLIKKMSEKGKNNHSLSGKGIKDSQRTHSEDGVDLTLIRWMLSLTPEERLITLQNNAWSLMRLRNGATKT